MFYGSKFHCMQSRVFGLIKLIENSVRCYSHSWVNGTMGSMDQMALTTTFLVELLWTFCNIQCIVPVHVSSNFYRGAMSRCCRRFVSHDFREKPEIWQANTDRNTQFISNFLWPYTNYMIYSELQTVILRIASKDCRIFTEEY